MLLQLLIVHLLCNALKNIFLCACRSWSTLASSTVSELACPSEPYEAGPGSQTWAVNTIAANYNLSVPFKAAATAAAGSTPGLLHCYA